MAALQNMGVLLKIWLYEYYLYVIIPANSLLHIDLVHGDVHWGSRKLTSYLIFYQDLCNLSEYIFGNCHLSVSMR